MGSSLIFNDTLNLSIEQGFPTELKLEQHLKNPYRTDDFKNEVYSFQKPELRFYHPQPNLVFLVENIVGKWVYWGAVHVLNATLDYVAKTTSGQYKIVSLFNPDEMKQAFRIRDMRPDFDYFAHN